MEKIKVLMIDDNVNLVEMVKEYFNQNGNIEIVLTANNGQDGIELLEKNIDKFDVLLLDLIMPKKDGLYVLSEIKRRKLDCNIIVETSYNSQDAIRQVGEYNVNYFILKPFELTDLESRIIDVAWADESSDSYQVDIEIYANDRSGLLADIIRVIGNTQCKLIAVNSRANKDKTAITEITIEVENKDELKKLILKI